MLYTMSDEAHIRTLIAAGALREAAAEVVSRYGPTIIGGLRAMLGNHADVMDAHAQWSENVLRGIGAFGGRSTVHTWARRLAWNAALNLRGQAHRRREQPSATGELPEVPEDASARSHLCAERRWQQLRELRAGIAPAEETLLSLRVEQELSWAEIAEVLSTEAAPLDATAARKRYERLRARLREKARLQGFVE